jgi:crotonobetainyl-CoA:carnitine CoA-transferase CaiB-like acyl-CoA transferase
MNGPQRPAAPIDGDYRLDAPCLPDPREEHDHLAGLLPAGMLPRAHGARPPGDDPAACAVLAWARSGLMHLTGQSCAPPLAPRAPVLARAAAVVAAIAELTGHGGDPVRLDLDHVLAFRASLNGWTRRGTISVNGTCRMLRAADGWLAVNLARPDDLLSVPAVLGRELTDADAVTVHGRAAEAHTPSRPAAADLVVSDPVAHRPACAALGAEAAEVGAAEAAAANRPAAGDPMLSDRAEERPVWAALRAEAATRPAAELAAAAQEVGIPAAPLPEQPSVGPVGPPPGRPGAAGVAAAPPLPRPAPVTMTQVGPAGTAPALVLDLSAMWAGPLCASILARAGWRVLKVEDARRPDGARSGPPAFYADLHAGTQTVILDFGSASGRAALHRLAARAGVVVESSRPRALRRLGLVAEDWLKTSPGRVWVSVTGYGREDPQQRVAFGDDAAVAGGLVAWAADGTPVFCGDAIADPLSGLYAALAALAARRVGGGWLADVVMAGVSADLARPASAGGSGGSSPRDAAAPAWPHVIARGGTAGAAWTVWHGDVSEPVRSW